MLAMTKDLNLWTREALKHFALPPISSVELINISENATFKVAAENGERWALRLQREGYHTDEAIRSELDWAMALRRDAAAITPIPVAGLNGHFLQANLPRRAVLFQWEEGVEPLIADDLAKSFTQLGEVTARMHLQAQQWRKSDSFQRFTWDFETSLGESAPHWGHWRKGMGVGNRHVDIFQRTVNLIGKRLSAYGKSLDRFGLVHGDLRLANLLVHNEQVKVIDFDDCGFSWFMYDAATPFSFYENDSKVPELLDAWKNGYRNIAPLGSEDEKEIGTFIMLRRLLLVAWIGTRSETELAQSMGIAYTEGSLELCERYLSAYSK